LFRQYQTAAQQTHERSKASVQATAKEKSAMVSPYRKIEALEEKK